VLWAQDPPCNTETEAHLCLNDLLVRHAGLGALFSSSATYG